MHATSKRLASLLSLTLLAFSLITLPGCGQTAKPSPTDAALNTPDGTTEKAPARPSDLKPPALPPQPGHIGRN